ncbi:MAG: FAD-dependent oxidoreductase [Oligoflexus sp.]
MHQTQQSQILWRNTTHALSGYPPLEGEKETDVVVIGAGITGLTTSLLLKRAGQRVIVLEKEHIGSGTTGSSSAHLTNLVDARYSKLIKTFDVGTSRRVARSIMSAIDQIEDLQHELNIDCEFKRVPGYFYAEDERDNDEITLEFEAAKRSGLAVTMEEKAPLPFANTSAFRVDGQAQFHPIKYLDGLAREVNSGESAIHENTRVVEIHDRDPCEIITEKGRIIANHVVLATHIPLGINLLQSELHSYRSFIITAKVAGSLPEGLYWDTQDPYHYIRAYQNGDEQIVIFGGKDHKVGEGSSKASFEKLEEYIRHRFDVTEILNKWSAQFHDPTDGLPFIGKNPFGLNVYIATGFQGDGLTFGTLSGMILSSMIVHGHHEYDDLYEPKRLKLSTAPNFLQKNFSVAKHFIGDRINLKSGKAVDELLQGEGCVIKEGRSYLAVYRDTNDELKTLSAVCPHMKCIVQWNDAEKSWDCPCHASRFSVDGKKMEGPAMDNLKKVDWQPTA